MGKYNNFNWRQYGVILLFFGCLLFLIGCSKNDDSVSADENTENLDNARPDCNSCNVLFIGSSYLAYIGNDVIDIFGRFAEAGGKNVNIERRDVGGRRLHHHVEDPFTLEKIRERQWDYVILQGNAAYLSKKKWHDNIIPFLAEMRGIIKETSPNACVVYMMPWAYLDGLAWLPDETETYEQMQDSLYQYTTQAVQELDIATAPAGWAWFTAIQNNYEAELYLNDFNHQSISGAYLTAAVFYTTVYGEEAPAITFPLQDLDDPPYLRTLGYQTVMNNLPLWNIY